MAYGYRGLILFSTFIVVDLILIWIVNTPVSTRVTTAPVATGDQFMITLALAGAGVIAVLAAIFYKIKPVPACFNV